ncbi:MAG: hypothetical protein LCH58_06110 [Bacteroidetes bacterium]|uniref:hypothetical protein n=1 Tax=Phnomibacter sp. TaxID=2836217 RepID=UPI002FDDA5D3|nr:hypothetical protein [Bacteroidota bacterium]
MSFQQQYLPRYQWANPYLFFPIPDTVITVDGTMLPIVARHRAYADEAEVFATVPAIARVEGALVAISDGGDGYNFYYWFINRTFAPFGCTWELKPLVPVSDTYELAFRLGDTGPGWNGASFTLPPLETIEKIVVHDGNTGIAGLGTSNVSNDILDTSILEGQNFFINVGHTNLTGVDQTIYINAEIYLQGPIVIVTIRKNPILKYPNL